MKNLTECTDKVFTAHFLGDPVIGTVRKGPYDKICLDFIHEGEVKSIGGLDKGDAIELINRGITNLSVSNHLEAEVFNGFLDDYDNYAFCGIFNRDGEDIIVEGRISCENGKVCFCQDKFYGSYLCDNLGYKYSCLVENDINANKFIKEFTLLQPFSDELTTSFRGEITSANHGDFFKTTEVGIGRINFEDGELFLCQNSYGNCENKRFNYSKSWKVVGFTHESIKYHGYTNFTLYKTCDLRNNLFKKLDFDLKELQEKRFKATIHGKEVVGKISVSTRGTMYLCQDSIEGSSCSEKWGYNYSWYVGSSLDVAILKEYNVENFRILEGVDTNKSFQELADKLLNTEKPISRYHLKYFVCRILGILTFGRAYVTSSKNLYLCQDSVNEVSSYLSEYKYAWSVKNNSIREDHNIKDFELFSEESTAYKEYESLRKLETSSLSKVSVEDFFEKAKDDLKFTGIAVPFIGKVGKVVDDVTFSENKINSLNKISKKQNYKLFNN